MKTFYVFFCAVLIVFIGSGVVASAADPVLERTPDGRFGTACPKYSTANGDVEICETSIFTLMSSPENYHGKYIRVTGFLVKYFDVVTLFPLAQSYQAQISIEGISIDGSIPDEIASELEKGIWPVTVIGKFDGRFRGYQIPAGGRIWDLRSIGKVPVLLK